MAEPRVTQNADGSYVIVDDDLGAFTGRTFDDAQRNYHGALMRRGRMRQPEPMGPPGGPQAQGPTPYAEIPNPAPAPPGFRGQAPMPPPGPGPGRPAPPGFRGMAPPSQMSEQPLSEEELKRALMALLGKRGGLQGRNPQGIQSIWDALQQGAMQ